MEQEEQNLDKPNRKPAAVLTVARVQPGCAKAARRAMIPAGAVEAALAAWGFFGGEAVNPERAMRAAIAAAEDWRASGQVVDVRQTYYAGARQDAMLDALRYAMHHPERAGEFISVTRPAGGILRRIFTGQAIKQRVAAWKRKVEGGL